MQLFPRKIDVKALTDHSRWVKTRLSTVWLKSMKQNLYFISCRSSPFWMNGWSCRNTNWHWKGASRSLAQLRAILGLAQVFQLCYSNVMLSYQFGLDIIILAAWNVTSWSREGGLLWIMYRWLGGVLTTWWIMNDPITGNLAGMHLSFCHLPPGQFQPERHPEWTVKTFSHLNICLSIIHRTQGCVASMLVRLV